MHDGNPSRNQSDVTVNQSLNLQLNLLNLVFNLYYHPRGLTSWLDTCRRTCSSTEIIANRPSLLDHCNLNHLPDLCAARSLTRCRISNKSSYQAGLERSPDFVIFQSPAINHRELRGIYM